jgi:hypothetical protein
MWSPFFADGQGEFAALMASLAGAPMRVNGRR